LFSRTKTLIFTVILTIILLVSQIYIIKTAINYEPKFDAVFSKIFIPSGTQITKDMLETRKTDIYHPKSYKSLADLEGKFAAADVEAGEMVLSSRVTDTIDEKTAIKTKKPGNVLYTVKFEPDQANGWLIKPDSLVHLIFVPELNRQKVEEEANILNDVILLENVRIAAVIDDKLKLYSDTSDSSAPKYISFELSKEQFKIIAQAKSKGRLEIAAVADWRKDI